MTGSVYRNVFYWSPSWLLAILFFLPMSVKSQKFYFKNYNVQQGLIQSQVNDICQDADDNIWIATLGGISRFDGRTFSNYSESDGLINNYARCIMADRSGFIWIGTRNGISKFDGSRFINFRINKMPGGNFVQSIVQDSAGAIWVHAAKKIYRYDPLQKMVAVTVAGPEDTVTAMAVDWEGKLWTAVLHKGLFRLEGQRWLKMIPLTTLHHNDHFSKIVFDRENRSRIFLLGMNRLVVAENDRLTDKASWLPYPENDYYENLVQDKKGRLWLVSRRALYQCVDFRLTPFNSSNGYTNSSTMAVFQDRENNIWFGTNGLGVMRYADRPFLSYDQFDAANNAIILYMMEGDDRRLYLGTDGSGLFVLDGNKITPVRIPSVKTPDQHIVYLSKGLHHEIYIVTAGSRIWKYADNRVTELILPHVVPCITGILPDAAGGYYLTGCEGCYYYSPEGKTTRILDAYCNNLLSVSGDSTLVSTLNGLYLIRGPQTFGKIDFPGADSCTFMSLQHLNKFYLLATANRGFILYNTITHTASRFTGKDGLNSDFVYSVAHDHQNQIWLGTGRGVNKLLLDTVSGNARISDISTPGDISSSECNQNAAVYDRQHLWFGTASGLMKFFPENDRQQDQYIPPVVLRGVELFSKKIPPGKYSDSTTSGYHIPYHLKLPHDQNHLSFEFGCASYLNGEKIRYQYQLVGMEKEFSAPTSNRFVVYSELPPGRYTFRVRAILPGYGFSANSISYPFIISAAFYQTLLFKLVLILTAVGLVLWMQWLRMNQRIRRLKQIEAIKKEENISVRQSTAEDFHDEVGNTLTRIQVLTDVLQARIGTANEEGNRLIAQIKENVSNLYRGTRDILWALNPGSDRLSEIAARLEIMGVEIFQDTAVAFRFENRILQEKEMTLPSNYSRNILLIFKEAMNNSLRHAEATLATLEIEREGAHHISILLKDNGSGFEPDLVKKGYGTGNMVKRAGRIHGEFSIDSRPGKGTACRLVVPAPPK